MEILTKFTPSFRLILFLLALPVFGFAQQFPVNNQKIVQGVGTTAQGISSYSSSPPTTAPTAGTFRHVTSLHMDTVLQVQYIYKRPRWYPISVVRRATPPPATASSGSTTIDYTESLWQSTADSLTYYYEEENACWQPIGTYLSSTTPSDVAATGSTGAICYGYGLWYDPDVDSIYAQQGATWTAIGSGGGGGGTFDDWTAAADSGTPAVISDGETVTHAGGYGINTVISGNTITSTADTSELVTPYDISGLPSGTGTDQRIVVWTGTNSQGNSTQLQSAAGVTLDANLAYRITGGTTASRPTGAAGMMYYNTTLGALQYYKVSAWATPLLSALDAGIGFAGRLFYGDPTTGFATQSADLFWNQTNSWLGIGTASPTNQVTILSNTASSAPTGLMVTNSSASGYSNIGFNANNSQIAETGASFASGGLIGSTFGHFTNAANGLSFIAYNATGQIKLFTGGIATTNERVRITSAGLVGVGTTSPDRLLHSELSDAVTNAMVFPLRLTHITSSTAAPGFGAGMEFEAESAGGTNRVAGTIENPYTTATNAAEVSDLVFRTMRAGTLTESLRSLGNGTLQIGTLSGTATQMVGATAGNILCPITLGAGLSFSSGTLNGAFLPLTLTGTTEVNTAGQVLRIRDAGAYPDVYMNSNYWTAASDVNTFIDVGSTSGQMQLNSAGRTIIAAATNVELQAGITGEARIDSDSLVLEGLYPVGTASDSVLVRDGATGRVNLRAQSSFGSGTYLPLTLSGTTTFNTSGNLFNVQGRMSFVSSAAETWPITFLSQEYDGIDFQQNRGSNSVYGDLIGGFQCRPRYNGGINSEVAAITGRYTGNGTTRRGEMIIWAYSAAGPGLFRSGTFGGDTVTVAPFQMFIAAPNSQNGLEVNNQKTVRLPGYGVGGKEAADLSKTNSAYIQSFATDGTEIEATAGAGLAFSGGVLSTSQSFFNDYDASISLTGVTSTPDTIDADSNTKSNDWGFNPTTSTYTYNGTTGRYYKVSVSAQMEDADASSEVLIITVYKNNTATSAVAQANQQSGTLDPVTMHGQAIILLSNGDTINAKVNSTGGTGDFNLQNYSLILEQL